MISKNEWIHLDIQAQLISDIYKQKILSYLINEVRKVIGTEYSGQEATLEYLGLGKILGKMVLDKIFK